MSTAKDVLADREEERQFQVTFAGKTDSIIVSENVAHNLEAIIEDKSRKDEKIKINGGTYTVGKITSVAPYVEEEAEKDEHFTQAQELIALAEEETKFLSGDDNHVYAQLPIENHTETWRVRSQQYREWLIRKYYELHKKPPGTQAVQDAIGAIEALRRGGEEHRVFVRIGRTGDALYVDLANDKWQAVEINASGWNIVTNPPVLFKRSNQMLPMPVPVTGGSLEDLMPFVGASDASDSSDDQKQEASKRWVMIVSFILGAYQFIWYENSSGEEGGGYPILTFTGGPGSAKSTIARIVRYMIDPSKNLLRSAPRNEQDLMIAASKSWIVAFDNITKINTWLADAMCRLATGGGYGSRTLFANDEETCFSARRPQIITGIKDIATQGDLLDRCILLNLPRINDENRWTEKKLWPAFREKYPLILGALFDVIVIALKNADTVNEEELPRMADFSEWIIATEPSLWKKGEFIKFYKEVQSGVKSLAIESSVIGLPLLKMLEGRTEWEGTATSLVEELEQNASEKATKKKDWPTPQLVTGMIRELTPHLKDFGITFEEKNVGGERKKYFYHDLENIGIKPSQPSQPSQNDDNNGQNDQKPMFSKRHEQREITDIRIEDIPL